MRELFGLPAAERRLFPRAVLAVVRFRIALWVLPFRRVASLAPRLSSAGPGPVPPERLGWVVRACARRIPWASCLTRALAVRWLLAREGRASTLHYGGAFDARGAFRAHAWVECDGRVVTGHEEDLSPYQPLGVLHPDGSHQAPSGEGRPPAPPLARRADAL